MYNDIGQSAAKFFVKYSKNAVQRLNGSWENLQVLLKI